MSKYPGAHDILPVRNCLSHYPRSGQLVHLPQGRPSQQLVLFASPGLLGSHFGRHVCPEAKLTSWPQLGAGVSDSPGTAAKSTWIAKENPAQPWFSMGGLEKESDHPTSSF